MKAEESVRVEEGNVMMRSVSEWCNVTAIQLAITGFEDDTSAMNQEIKSASRSLKRQENYTALCRLNTGFLKCLGLNPWSLWICYLP